nr:transposase [Candidatus Enterovibrio escacola]
MTRVIVFHQSWYRDFKTYYIHFVCHYLANEFSELVSCTRMLKLMQDVLVTLFSYLTHRQGLLSLIHPSYRFITTYDDQCGIISVKLMRTNVNDRKLVPEMADEILGCLYGDKGYISDPFGASWSKNSQTLE